MSSNVQAIMRRNIQLPLCTALAVAILGCGGGDDANSYFVLAGQARQLQDTATALGNDTPCQADANCSVIAFAGVCGDVYAPLSLASPNADRAVFLANAQRRLMEAAKNAPDYAGSAASCAPPLDRPVGVCVQTQCTLQYKTGQ